MNPPRKDGAERSRPGWLLSETRRCGVMLKETPTLDHLAADAVNVCALDLDTALELLAAAGRLRENLRVHVLRLMAPSRRPQVTLDVLTTKQVADMWQMPEAKIRELCRSGDLPARKLGATKWVIGADALREWLPKSPVANGISPRLSLPHDPERGSGPSQAPRPYSVVIRRPARRPQDHGRQVGGGHERPERHDGQAATHHREAGTEGARTASGDDSPSKGALT